MTKRKISSIIFGTILLFVWNAISWMVLPFHTNTLNSIPQTALDTALLKNNLPGDGVYHYPGLPQSNTQEALQNLEQSLKQGPRITLMVYKSGPSELFNPLQFVWSLIINLCTVLLLFFLVIQLKRKTLVSILIQCIVVGLLIGVVSDFGQMNWYQFPLDYTLVNVFDRIIPFALLGLLFGLFTFKKIEE